MHELLPQLRRLLQPDADQADRPLGDPSALAQSLAAAAEEQELTPVIRDLVGQLRLVQEPLSPSQQRVLDAFLQTLVRQRMQALHQQRVRSWSREEIEQFRLLYELLQQRRGPAHWTLALLATDPAPAALRAFAELVSSRGPEEPRACDLAFMPLFLHRPGTAHQELFPRLLDLLGQRAMAGCILDLANFFTRQGIVQQHPGRKRLSALVALYRGLVNHLEDLETSPQKYARDAGELKRLLDECVPLVVSLTDALALAQAEEALPLLRRALELSHRRVQAEAAAALARLGQEDGFQALGRLLQHPGTRRRAAAYLKELGQAQRIPPELNSPVALAEAHLAEHLADPHQVGMAPGKLRLLDQRKLFWPGFHEPQPCYLFEYQYELPSREFTGVGMAGPVVHSFFVDLHDLPPRDIYAAYAGWSVEDASMSETPREQFSAEQWEQAQLAQQQLLEQGLADVQVVKLGSFYGQPVAVAVARRSGQLGTAVWDGRQLLWFPATRRTRSLGPDEAWYIYKGRRLLDAFNGPGWWEQDGPEEEASPQTSP